MGLIDKLFSMKKDRLKAEIEVLKEGHRHLQEKNNYLRQSHVNLHYSLVCEQYSTEILYDIAIDLDAQVSDLHERTQRIIDAILSAPSARRMSKGDTEVILGVITGES